MANSYSVAATLQANVTETLDDPALASGTELRHTGYSDSYSFTGSTDPAVTKAAIFLATLSGGSLSLDLTALAGTNDADVDGTGLKVQLVKIKNLGSNALTVAVGASNGYALFGTSNEVDIPAGGDMIFNLADGSPTIGAGAKTLDLTGTDTETSEWTILMG